MKPKHIIIGVVVVMAAAFLIPSLMTEQPGTRSTQGDTITQTIGLAETNSSVTFDVALVEGSDAEHESEHMFGALKGLQGVGRATLDARTLQLTVEYDSALVPSRSIRDRVLAAGYLAPTIDDATPLVLSEDGSVQRIDIKDEGTGFDPFFIRAQAGVPIEITYGPGQECRSSVKFPALGIEQNILDGGVVTLPALAAGEYEIYCSGDGYEGLLFVE